MRSRREHRGHEIRVRRVSQEAAAPIPPQVDFSLSQVLVETVGL